MGKYTLDMDFSSLNGPKAHNWILKFRDLADTAFDGKDNRARLLGNLLIIELYVHTLESGLSAEGRRPSAVLERVLGILWGYLEDHELTAEVQEFANNIYASTLAHDVGEALTEGQENFYREHVDGLDLSAIEWQTLGWASGLLMEVVVIEGGRLEFEELEGYEQISFANVDDLLAFLTDAGIYITQASLPPSTGADYEKAAEQVYQTALFRTIIEQIQGSLNAARTAEREQYPTLRAEYQKRTLVPLESIPSLMDFLKM